ncbi:MAG: family 20 glycosylhydrolase [Chloroflexi bacterium]|mgnify:CR=1 FL=1|nr:family 20 glycosylhydrolase [Chloroflexota bacterium]
MIEHLLPAPRQIERREGRCALPARALIAIPGANLLFEAQTAQRALAEGAGRAWEIVAGSGYADAGLTLRLDPTAAPAQGYRLDIAPGGIAITGADPAGVFYGVGTLRQIVRQRGADLPALAIADWPDFPARGVMLDISRDRVPTLATVMDLIDRLAGWKINQFQLYMEHTFAYRAHPEVWASASPFTGEEILLLDAYCRQRHITLVPNQNSLGHMERWLKLDRYRPLAECPDGFTNFYGEWSGPTTLNPVDPASLELMAGLYDELLPHFTSPLFNVGGDEPWELGQGRSKARVEERGAGRVYLDTLLGLHERVAARGRRMQFWGDIIIHYPELVPELPPDAIAMEWGYEADHPFDAHGALFAGAGIPFYVVPGTSGWNSLAGRTDNAVGNLLNAAANGLKHGAVGYLTTEWGDYGHWQPQPVNYLGYAYGAALSWAVEANRAIDLPRCLDLFAFEDAAGVMGRLAYDLGNVYRLPGLARHNGHRLFDLFHRTLARQWTDPFEPDVLRAALDQIDAITAPLDSAQMARPDAGLVRAEYRMVADLLRHACWHGLQLAGQPVRTPGELLADLERLAAIMRENWLARSRPGGLDDSLARLDYLRGIYREQTG